MASTTLRTTLDQHCFDVVFVQHVLNSDKKHSRQFEDSVASIHACWFVSTELTGLWDGTLLWCIFLCAINLLKAPADFVNDRDSVTVLFQQRNHFAWKLFLSQDASQIKLVATLRIKKSGGM